MVMSIYIVEALLNLNMRNVSFKVYRFSHEGKSYSFFCIPYHKCKNHTVPFEKREESCHQKRDMPLGRLV